MNTRRRHWPDWVIIPAMMLLYGGGWLAFRLAVLAVASGLDSMPPALGWISLAAVVLVIGAVWTLIVRRSSQ